MIKLIKKKIEEQPKKWYLTLNEALWAYRICGGINPYTLMAKLGPAQIGGSGPPKDDVWPGQPDRSPVQGGKADLAINQDPGRLE